MLSKTSMDICEEKTCSPTYAVTPMNYIITNTRYLAFYLLMVDLDRRPSDNRLEFNQNRHQKGSFAKTVQLKIIEGNPMNEV